MFNRQPFYGGRPFPPRLTGRSFPRHQLTDHEPLPRCMHQIMEKVPQGTLGPRYQVTSPLHLASVAGLRFVADVS